MTDRANHKPNELSGGQKQRIAIARAMINSPSVLLADEPTGALDSKTGRMIMDLFHKLHQEKGKTIILITHNNELAWETDRILTLSDGNIVSETFPHSLQNASFGTSLPEEAVNRKEGEPSCT
jgi:putative ABC transport system ATP-binding protein